MEYDCLINDDLYSENIINYKNKDLPLVQRPNTVGIISKLENGIRIYIAYSTDERGALDLTFKTADFDEAIGEARFYYAGLLGYFKSMLSNQEGPSKR